MCNRGRKQTEKRIIDAFTDAGLRFERLSGGGFKLTVPNKAIANQAATTLPDQIPDAA